MLSESRASERATAQGVTTLFTSTGQLLSGALVGAIAASGSYAQAFFVISFIGMVLVLLSALLKGRSAELATSRQNSAESPAFRQDLP